MKIAKIATFVTAAAIGIFATTISALALSAVATGAVNVRTGPSVGYIRVDTLYRGETVNVTQCQSGWCYVQHSGPDGWVSRNYLSISSAPAPTPPRSQANVSFGLSFGTGGSSFSITIGGGRNRGYTPYYRSPKVCFFNGVNYSGASFCVNAGSRNNRLRGYWNDKISSIRLQHGASVTLCRNRHFGGFCRTISSNASHLGPFLNNKTSSFKTY